MQIQIHPQTSIEPKYDVIYLNNKVRVHGLVLLVQLSKIVGSLFSRKEGVECLPSHQPSAKVELPPLIPSRFPLK